MAANVKVEELDEVKSMSVAADTELQIFEARQPVKASLAEAQLKEGAQA